MDKLNDLKPKTTHSNVRCYHCNHNWKRRCDERKCIKCPDYQKDKELEDDFRSSIKI